MGRIALILLPFVGMGCGTTVSRSATDQLLKSGAVDQAVAAIDFRALQGRTVFFDTAYIKHVKELGFVNAEYIISSMRQQLIASRCQLKDKKEDADFIVEARVGALGADSHEVTYGIPANGLLSTAATLVPNSPPLPTIPEISVAKKHDQLGAAKIAVFAYHRESGLPLWQSGIATARSDAKDVWVLGAGPFQRGSIRKSTQFAGSELGFSSADEGANQSRVDYNAQARFNLDADLATKAKIDAEKAKAKRAAEEKEKAEQEAAEKAKKDAAKKAEAAKPEVKPDPKPAESKPAEPPNTDWDDEWQRGFRLQIRLDNEPSEAGADERQAFPDGQPQAFQREQSLEEIPPS